MRDNAIERGVSIGRDQDQFVSLIVNITHLAGLLLSEVPEIGFLEYVHCLRPWLGAGRESSPWQFVCGPSFGTSREQVADGHRLPFPAALPKAAMKPSQEIHTIADW
jgi:hypothetical protein